MHLHKLPLKQSDFQWIGVEGLRLEEPLKVDKSLTDLQKISERREVPLQIIEAKYLAGPRHAFHAGYLALTAQSEKRARANKIEIEMLLYITGKRQIGEAIRDAGVKSGTTEIAVIALGPSEKALRGTLDEVARTLQGEEDDNLLEITALKKRSLQRLFEITDEELALVSETTSWRESLLKCVMERGAMLDALKK